LTTFIIFMFPLLEDLIENPECEVATIDESLTLFCPVYNFVNGFILFVRFLHDRLREMSENRVKIASSIPPLRRQSRFVLSFL
jgi:hypothetical protein